MCPQNRFLEIALRIWTLPSASSAGTPLCERPNEAKLLVFDLEDPNTKSVLMHLEHGSSLSLYVTAFKPC